VRISGCTAHLVQADVDTGPVIAQAAVAVLQDDSPASLALRIQSQEHRILPWAIALAGTRWRNSLALSSAEIRDKRGRGATLSRPAGLPSG
jgi:phosphoribosylglycinamide formyltransferase-1